MARGKTGRGESRDTVLSHEAPHTKVTLIEVGTGGVDRKTGAPIRTYWELVVKLRGKAEITRTFSHEVNARIAYLMAQHGILDFKTALKDIEGPRLWDEPRNMTALAKLERREPPVSPVWTRINTDDSEAESASGPDPAPITHGDSLEADLTPCDAPCLNPGHYVTLCEPCHDAVEQDALILA